jgi:hypothetical protein
LLQLDNSQSVKAIVQMVTIEHDIVHYLIKIELANMLTFEKVYIEFNQIQSQLYISRTFLIIHGIIPRKS